MVNLNAIRAMAVAIVAGLAGACGQALDCVSTQCVPDQIYQGSLSTVEGHGPTRVERVKMEIGPYGWTALKPAAPPRKPLSDARDASFDKAFLEVNEQGLLFDPNQLRVILDHIEALKDMNRPIFLFTYAHGWHHNASTPFVTKEEDALRYNAIKFDYLMARFAEHVRRLYELNGDDHSPSMFGVYIGWRGKSTDDPLVNLINVGNRAETADVIAKRRGPGSLHEALTKISERLAKTGPSARMIASGHSLGGRLMSQMFLREIAGGELHPLGRHTLIAAIEPAISAACYDDIFARGTIGKAGRLPSFISITSSDDLAVVKGFSLGHLAPSLDPPRCDDSSPARNFAIGAYASYVTHYWKFTRDSDDNIPVRKTGCNAPEIQRDPHWLFKRGDSPWRYPRFKEAEPCPNMAGKYMGDVAPYTLNVDYGAAHERAGAVWNVQTNRYLIDTALDTRGKNVGDLHNGFASTGLADILGRIAYAQMRWEDQGSPATVPEPAPRPTAR